MFERHLQGAEQGMQGAWAGLGTAGFDAAQVALRQARQQRQVELAEAGMTAQAAQVLAGVGDCWCLRGVKGRKAHASTLAVLG